MHFMFVFYSPTAGDFRIGSRVTGSGDVPSEQNAAERGLDPSEVVFVFDESIRSEYSRCQTSRFRPSHPAPNPPLLFRARSGERSVHGRGRARSCRRHNGTFEPRGTERTGGLESGSRDRGGFVEFRVEFRAAVRLSSLRLASVPAFEVCRKVEEPEKKTLQELFTSNLAPWGI